MCSAEPSEVTQLAKAGQLKKKKDGKTNSRIS